MGENLTEEEKVRAEIIEDVLYELSEGWDYSDQVASAIERMIDLRVKRALDKYHEETQIITVNVNDEALDSHSAADAQAFREWSDDAWTTPRPAQG